METILVVDDDAQVLAVVRKVLASPFDRPPDPWRNVQVLQPTYPASGRPSRPRVTSFGDRTRTTRCRRTHTDKKLG
jgi:hypothetical protein